MEHRQACFNVLGRPPQILPLQSPYGQDRKFMKLKGSLEHDIAENK